MSDKHDITIVEPDTPQKAKPLRKYWLVFLGILLLIILLLTWFLLSTSTSLDGIKRFFRYFGKDETQYGRLQFETYGTCCYTLADGRFAVATQSGAALYANDGSTLSRVQGSFLNPAMQSADEFLLIYDLGGTRLVLIDGEGSTLLDATASGVIYDAEVSSEGFISVLSEGKDCRATLTVYTKNGATPYVRNAKNNYLNTCAVSPDGDYAAATTLGQQEISFVSTAQILKTDQEEIAAEVSLGAQIVYDLRFLDNDTLCAIGEQSIVFFDTEGDVLGEYPANNGVIDSYSFGGDGFVTVLYDQYEAGGGSRLVTLDKRGKEIAYASLDRSPLHLSACGGYVCVLNEQELQIFSRKLALCSSTDNTGYLAAFVRSDGTAICVSSGEAELFIP